MLSDAVRFLLEQDDFTIIAHVSPDGDTLGSCLALYLALTRAGKQARLVCEDPVPQIYRFLPSAGDFLPAGSAPAAKTAVAVDCADLARTGAAERLFRQARHTLNIDHHSTNGSYGEVNYVEPVAAAGELVYRVLREAGLPVTAEIAACLFVALSTDTGNFSYSNTTPDTFRISADLLDAGIDLPYLNRMVFRTVPLHKTRLLALAVMKTELYENGKIAMTMLGTDDFRSCGAPEEDSEGIIDVLRDIDTVEIAVFLRESADGKVKVSLRGKSYADVSFIAVRHGGGGHRLAAGCTMTGPMEEARDTILGDARSCLNGEA